MGADPSLHPTDQTLRSYGLGRLDDGASEAVSRHLEGCPGCRKRVMELSADSFLGRVRDAQAQGGARSATGGSETGAAAGTGGPMGKTPPPADTLPPGLADHPDYEIRRELGRGGMGVVYLAHNALMGRDEVLKVMGRHIVERPGVLDRFLREIRAVARLRHPNIVAAYSASRLGESLVFSMEYVEGLDLARMVKIKGPMPVAHACLFIHQAALGLQHAHEEGLVHRDIKPHNLMLSRKGDKGIVKVLDFGLAKATREQGVDGGLTLEGQALGTPDYIAPEQILDAQRADIRADIYSLGGTLYFLLAGRPPFRANSLYDMYQAHISLDADPLNLVRPEVPSELAALVAKMMAKDPARRFQTPAEVAEALTPFFKKGAAPPARSNADAPRGGGPGAVAPISSPPPKTEGTGREAGRVGEVVGPAEAAPRWEKLVDLQEDRELSIKPLAPVPARRLPRSALLAAPGVVLLGLFAAWMAGVLKVKTPEGVIVVEGIPKDAEVLVDGGKISLNRPGGVGPVEIRAVPGRGEVEVKKGGLTASAKELTLRDDGAEGVAVRLEPAAVVATPAATSAAGRVADDPSEKEVENSLGMALRFIPAGEFVMGAPDPARLPADAAHREEFHIGVGESSPRRKITITRPFYLGIYEVTQGEYQACLGANPSANPASPRHPVDSVSWLDAVAFCNRLSEKEGLPPYYKIEGTDVAALGGDGYRLPTEAEWEYACTAGEKLIFEHGNDWQGLGDRAWFGTNSGKRSHPVGQKLPNRFGLFDMVGNVREWCWDRRAPYPPDQPAAVDPQGPARGYQRMTRGGSFGWNTVYICTPWCRQWGADPDAREPFTGFRVARTAAPTSRIAGVPSAVRDAALGPVGPGSVSPPITPPATVPGFRPLFNGKDLTGWAGAVDGFEVAGGILSGRPGRRAEIYEPVERGDFAARVEFRLTPGAEGGLLIRYPGRGDSAFDSMCEIQILDDSHPSYAPADARCFHGSAWGIAAARRGHLKPPGEWNVQEVTVLGSTVKVVLNGAVILDTDLAPIRDFAGGHPHPGKDRTAGFFGLQSGAGANRSSVEYRKIEVRDLSLAESAGPADTDSLQPGSVWVSEPGNNTFTVLERRGDQFKARFEVGRQVREVSGTIRDGRLRWLARDVKAIVGKPGHDNEGVIEGDTIAMTWSAPGGPTLGRFTLRLRAPTPGRKPPRQTAARPDHVQPGSIWTGSRTYPPGDYNGATVTYFLHVRERKGAKFKGHKFDNGANRNRTEVEGEIQGDVITWADLSGKESRPYWWLHRGVLQGERIRFQFESPGNANPAEVGSGELTLTTRAPGD